MALCLLGGRLAGSRDADAVAVFLFVLAVPLWIVVSLISYKALKPESEKRE
jgi:hypothetical protein